MQKNLENMTNEYRALIISEKEDGEFDQRGKKGLF